MSRPQLLMSALLVAALGLAGCGEAAQEDTPSAAGSPGPGPTQTAVGEPATIPTSPASSAPAPSTEAPAASPPPSTGTGTSVLPALTVDDVAGGQVVLASLAPASQPLLVWFWAPH